MGRVRKLTLTDWTSANNALIQYFEGNKTKLAKHVDMSRTTVNDFFTQAAIGENSFRKICLALRLNPQKVSVIAPSSTEIFPASSPSSVNQFNEIPIQQVRAHCRQKILEQHSRMRLLSGEEIGVKQLYVDVWLLEKPERKHFNTLESLLNSYNMGEDRLALGKRIHRNPGIEIANSNSRLVILGKPGSGKTTFLKQIAVDWCNQKFKRELITIFIELRRIRLTTWNLFDAIDRELGWQNWKHSEEKINQIARLKDLIELANKQQDRKYDSERETKINALEQKLKVLEKQLEVLRKNVKNLFHSNKLLILMDGLDEVPTNELRKNVQTQVKQVSDEFVDKNQFILTCRTQVIGTIPGGFTSVEVADFNSEQVKQFVQKWFSEKGKAEAETNKRSEIIEFSTINQPDLKELTATPVLLSLICVVWQDSGEIPKNRTSLYKKGVNWLLSRWNEKKEIEGWEVGTKAYRQLKTEDKEALLMEIAARKFEKPKNFVLFEQDELVKQIAQKLQIANRREGVAVLKAIETQHGLLIERADELWSFSHLTFQEYFTVQWLTQLQPQQLAEKISNKQWQQVVEKLVKSQQPADHLLRIIKQAIDQSIASEQNLQTLLNWLVQKSKSIQTPYKRAAIQSFYCSLVLALALDRNLTLALDLNLALNLGLDIDRAFSFDLTPDLALDLALALELDCTLDSALHRRFDLDHALKLDLSQDLVRDRILALALTRDRTIEKNGARDPVLTIKMQSLKAQLKGLNDKEKFRQWWRKYGQDWIIDLRKVMAEHRNIGHDWELTKQQKLQLQLYYDANKFLVELMKIEGATSEDCRAEIEEGLLLPWAELQCRQPHLYGELEEF